MRPSPLHRFLIVLPLLALATAVSLPTLHADARRGDPPPSAADIYEIRKASRDGIGKFYLGREIAAVMGFEGARWLERRSREREEQPDKVIASLGLRPSDVVADIGAGSGYFTFRLAATVPAGKVLAVDIQQPMLDLIERRKEERGVDHIDTILGSEADPGLSEASVDLALMVDAYHELAFPYEMMTALVRALKPGGRVVLVEYRGEDPKIAIKRLHKMTARQVKKEMAFVGLEWLDTKDFLPSQHILFFRKPAADVVQSR